MSSATFNTTAVYPRAYQADAFIKARYSRHNGGMTKQSPETHRRTFGTGTSRCLPCVKALEIFLSVFRVASANHVRLFHSRSYFFSAFRISFRVVKDLGKSSSAFVKSL